MKRYRVTITSGEHNVTHEVFAVNEESAKTKLAKKLGYYNTDIPYSFTEVTELTSQCVL